MDTRFNQKDTRFNQKTDDTPLVSVIIPSYNYEEFIAQTLSSLVSQTYSNWEAIVVDDGSLDGTQAIVEEYIAKEQRVRYIFQKNAGLSSARNTGIKASKGKYIQFLDADDLLSRHKLSVQVEFMEFRRECEISYTDAYYFSDNDLSKKIRNINKTDTEWMPKVSGKLNTLLPFFIKMNIMVVNSALIRRSFLETNNLFFDPRYCSLEDWNFWIRGLFAGAKIEYVENRRAYAFVRIHNKSMTNDKERMGLSEIKLQKELKNYITNQYFESDKPKLLKLNKRQLRNAGRKYIRPIDRIKYSNLFSLINKIGLTNSFISWVKELNMIRKQR